MRVKHILQNSSQTLSSGRQMLSHQLSSAMASIGDIEIVDTLPELVHVFGNYTAVTARFVSQFSKRHIPVLFTSIDGIAPLLSKDGFYSKSLPLQQAVRSICKNATHIHVGGPSESAALQHYSPQLAPIVIPIAECTSLTTTEYMLSQFAHIYQAMHAAADQHLRTHAQSMAQAACGAGPDEAITTVCAQLAYLHCLYTKGCIRRSVLTQSATLLINTDYDERQLSATLGSMNLLSFASNCMTLLQNEAHLTEGFMPIPATHGKLLTEMQNMIVD